MTTVSDALFNSCSRAGNSRIGSGPRRAAHTSHSQGSRTSEQHRCVAGLKWQRVRRRNETAAHWSRRQNKRGRCSALISGATQVRQRHAAAGSRCGARDHVPASPEQRGDGEQPPADPEAATSASGSNGVEPGQTMNVEAGGVGQSRAASPVCSATLLKPCACSFRVAAAVNSARCPPSARLRLWMRAGR